MKFKLHKKSKKASLLILILLTVLSVLQLFLLISFPKKTTTEIVQYESNLKPQLSYVVNIVPNEVYTGTTLDEGKIYSKKLLNNIQAEYVIDYTGSKKVPLDIEYQIVATVNGYQGTDKEKVIYWSKAFPLTSKKLIKEESGTWSKKERISFSLSGYDAFTVRAQEITGMDVTNELYVSMIGKIMAHTENEDLETPFDVKLRIPLMEDTFEVTKSNLDPVSSNIAEKVESKASMNKFQAFSYGLILLLCLIGFVVLLFFTREPNYEEELRKKVNNIIKNYGSRIVALQSIPKMNCRQHYKVHSMKDLIKIADELQKPIFYEIDKDTAVKNYEFHIIEDDILYSLFLDSPES